MILIQQCLYPTYHSIIRWFQHDICIYFVYIYFVNTLLYTWYTYALYIYILCMYLLYTLYIYFVCLYSSSGYIIYLYIYIYTKPFSVSQTSSHDHSELMRTFALVRHASADTYLLQAIVIPSILERKGAIRMREYSRGSFCIRRITPSFLYPLVIPKSYALHLLSVVTPSRPCRVTACSGSKSSRLNVCIKVSHSDNVLLFSNMRRW